MMALTNLPGRTPLGAMYRSPLGVLAMGTPGDVKFSDTAYTAAENCGSVTITVNRVGGSSGIVSVDYETSNGTAIAGSDYTYTHGTLTWASGDVADKTFAVPILTDIATEGSETANITLSNPTGGATIIGTNPVVLTITDITRFVSFLSPTGTYLLSTCEGRTKRIAVRRTGTSSGAISVQYATSNGTAIDGEDYTGVSGTLNWASGDTANKYINIVTIDNDSIEASETFFITLSNPVDASIISTNPITVTIVDACAINFVLINEAINSAHDADGDIWPDSANAYGTIPANYDGDLGAHNTYGGYCTASLLPWWSSVMVFNTVTDLMNYANPINKIIPAGRVAPSNCTISQIGPTFVLQDLIDNYEAAKLVVGGVPTDVYLHYDTSTSVLIGGVSIFSTVIADFKTYMVNDGVGTVYGPYTLTTERWLSAIASDLLAYYNKYYYY